MVFQEWRWIWGLIQCSCVALTEDIEYLNNCTWNLLLQIFIFLYSFSTQLFSGLAGLLVPIPATINTWGSGSTVCCSLLFPARLIGGRSVAEMWLCFWMCVLFYFIFVTVAAADQELSDPKIERQENMASVLLCEFPSRSPLQSPLWVRSLRFLLKQNSK